jgi:hypothetical protein
MTLRIACRHRFDRRLKSATEKDTLAELMRYSIAGRYPETLDDPLSRDEAKVRTGTVERVYKWLLQQL